MKVVVLGASGNAGTALLRALDAEPRVEDVVAVARRPPHEWHSPKTTWRSLDVATDALEPVVRGADVVVHLAWLIQPARDLEQCRAVNVNGSGRVMAAVAQARVPALVYASSVGAYSRGPKDRLVDESWPTGGVPTSFYSRHKVEVERLLDGFELERPEVRVVRLRPGLIFKRQAASEIRRLFAGPLLPSPLLRKQLIPFVPRIDRLRFQAVHSLDAGEAYRLAIVSEARGAFNIAAEPVLDSDQIGRLLGARPVPLPTGVLRTGAALSWRLRLQPSPAGWIDMALGVPLMDTTRAREQLGWGPTFDAGEALTELIDGLRDRAGLDTPPLSPDSGGPLRVREIVAGLGGRGR